MADAHNGPSTSIVLHERREAACSTPVMVSATAESIKNAPIKSTFPMLTRSFGLARPWFGKSAGKARSSRAPAMRPVGILKVVAVSKNTDRAKETWTSSCVLEEKHPSPRRSFSDKPPKHGAGGICQRSQCYC